MYALSREVLKCFVLLEIYVYIICIFQMAARLTDDRGNNLSCDMPACNTDHTQG